jgi:hypothetical protein
LVHVFRSKTIIVPRQARDKHRENFNTNKTPRLSRNTSKVLKNAASPKGSGYWTGPLWPINGSQTKGTAPGFEPDPGCPDGGCLFNLRLDRTEHQEFSSEQPELRARMAARMVRTSRHHALHLIRLNFLHG